MTTILVSAPYIIPEMERFGPVLQKHDLKLIITEVEERLSEEEILSYAGQFDGTLCGDDQYTARALEACAPRLKVLSKWGTGIDSFDQEAARRLNIQIFRTPNAFTLPVADSVLAYMLAFARQQPWIDSAMKAGVWKKIPGRSLSECTLGVIGVGNIGKAVLRRARVFGMELLGNDIIEIAPDFIKENGVQMVSLEELLGRSDFISVNCDLNSTSFKLINSDTLKMVKPKAVLINTARGPIIDEKALFESLNNGNLAGAALDVFEVEPLPVDSPLRAMENVLLAPHNANSSPAAWERVHWNTIRNLIVGLEITPEFEENQVLEAKLYT